MDQERLRYDVWTNFALQQEDEAYLGIMNYYGRPNNPYKNAKIDYANVMEKQREETKNIKFKSEQNRLWNESLIEGTYAARI